MTTFAFPALFCFCLHTHTALTAIQRSHIYIHASSIAHAIFRTQTHTHTHGRPDTLPITPAQTWEFFAEKNFLRTVITISNAIFDLKSLSCQLETNA